VAIVILVAGCTVGPGRTFAFQLSYTVGPAGGASPSDHDVQTVAITIGARLSQTGLADYRVRTPGGAAFTVEGSPASAADVVRALVGAAGHLALVPLGHASAAPKDPVDLAAHPALLAEQDVTHATPSTDAAGRPIVTLQLAQPAALTLFGWSSAHTGETLAIVLDGVVVMAAAVTGPMDGGLVIVGGLDASDASQFAAIVNGGPLGFPVTEVQPPGGSAAP
jgi:preprotein translocase subunit SecD